VHDISLLSSTFATLYSDSMLLYMCMYRIVNPSQLSKAGPGVSLGAGLSVLRTSRLWWRSALIGTQSSYQNPTCRSPFVMQAFYLYIYIEA
jgi:hypothetical protein